MRADQHGFRILERFAGTIYRREYRGHFEIQRDGEWQRVSLSRQDWITWARSTHPPQ